MNIVCYIHVIVYRGHLSTPEVKQKRPVTWYVNTLLLNKNVMKKNIESTWRLHKRNVQVCFYIYITEVYKNTHLWTQKVLDYILKIIVFQRKLRKMWHNSKKRR